MEIAEGGAFPLGVDATATHGSIPMAITSGKPQPRPLSEIEFRAAELWFKRLPKHEICEILKAEFKRETLSRTTLYRWATLPGFQEALAQLRRERLEEAFREIDELLPEAPGVIQEIMQGKGSVQTPQGYRDVTPAERLRAVDMVYSIARWMYEMDRGILPKDEEGGAASTPEEVLARVNRLAQERGLANVVPLWGESQS